MVTPDPQFTQALNAWLLQNAGSARGVSVVELADRLCVIKFSGTSSVSGAVNYGLRYLRASLISALCWWGLKERPSPRVLLRNSLDDETQRLLALHASHYPAPEILCHRPGVLVLAFAGDSTITKFSII
jgi:hypothetical protein